MKSLKIGSALVIALLASAGLNAQSKSKGPDPADFTFTTIKENPITSVKNQYRTGTCWAFSTIGFVESEIIRLNKLKEKDYPDFSEMFVVSKSYQDRAEKYIRLDGNLTFAAGSEADDVLHVIADYGLVPQNAMTGLNYGKELHDHTELDAALAAYISAINKNHGKKLSTAWKRGFAAVLDAYLGQCPEEFELDGKKYTPTKYRDNYKFNPDDYVTLSSFTHHPFYKPFVIEVCDNWRYDMAYNLPLDEFMEVLYYAIDNGYTAAWGTDVSETGFTRNGLALNVPEPKAKTGSDQEKWVGKEAVKEDSLQKKKIVEELPVTQESRQEAFDNKTTTDDHGMQIYGTAKDQDGRKYFLVKNSWGETGAYKGIWYASDAFVRAKSLDIVVHKDALPKAIRKKLGI